MSECYRNLRVDCQARADLRYGVCQLRESLPRQPHHLAAGFGTAGRRTVASSQDSTTFLLGDARDPRY